MDYKQQYKNLLEFILRSILFALTVAVIHFLTDGFDWKAALTYVHLFGLWLIVKINSITSDLKKY